MQINGLVSVLGVLLAFETLQKSPDYLKCSLKGRL